MATLGDHGGKHVSAVAAAKAGIARFTETLANELADTNIVALAIHPGFVRTPMTEHLAWSETDNNGFPTSGCMPNITGEMAHEPCPWLNG